MKKYARKLQLSRETLQNLTIPSRRVVGGLETDAPDCNLEQIEPTTQCGGGSATCYGCGTTWWTNPCTFGGC